MTIYKALLFVSLLLVCGAGITLCILFYPAIKSEIKYNTLRLKANDTNLDYQKLIYDGFNYSLFVPKINANAPIVENVDPFDSVDYLRALKTGVAHAKNSGSPDKGTMFIFAHSTDTFYNANKYNAVFYLLPKLEVNDEILILSKRLVYKYTVTEKQVVGADALEYLTYSSSDRQLILMTCWPAGTTISRHIVIAKFVEDFKI